MVEPTNRYTRRSRLWPTRPTICPTKSEEKRIYSGVGPYAQWTLRVANNARYRLGDVTGIDVRFSGYYHEVSNPWRAA
jgi:hypothetical protein